MKNQEMRFLLKQNRIPFWMIAERIGISEPTMTRWMRTPLDEKKQKKILDAIERIKRERGDVNECNCNKV